MGMTKKAPVERAHAERAPVPRESAWKSPAEKLPLAVRKNVRDEWENKKPDLESRISSLLSAHWTIDINPLAIYPYGEEGSWASTSLGAVIYDYIEGFVYQLRRFLDSHGTCGKDELNAVCPSHTISLLPSIACGYCGVKVEAGRLCLLFGPTHLGTNASDAACELPDAVSNAPQPSGAPFLSFTARHSIKTDYEACIAEVQEKAAAALQNPRLKFEPGFNELGKMLKGTKGVQDGWERHIGSFALGYYQAFVDVLAREKFGEDELLREGFAESVPTGAVKLRIVDRLEKGSYNEIFLDDGAVVIQTLPEHWGTNVYDAPADLLQIL